MIPFQTVRSYTKRPLLEEELARLLTTIRPDRDPPRSIALWGLNGGGKTQLALRFIEEHRSDYNTILWIDAQSPATTIRSFRIAFEVLGLDYPIHVLDQLRKDSGPVNQDPFTVDDNWVVKAVIEYLEVRPHESCTWLVVIDGADDLRWLHGIIPRGERGSIIITSHDRFISKFANYAIYVGPLESDEALSLLFNSANILDEQHSNQKSFGHWYKSKYKHALAIVNELGRLPIAIDNAGDYISQHEIVKENLTLYLDQFEQNADVVLGQPNHEDESQRHLTLATVWELSFTAIQDLNPEAASLLLFLAELSPNAEDRLFVEAGSFLHDSHFTETFWRQIVLFLQCLACIFVPQILTWLVIRSISPRPLFEERFAKSLSIGLTVLPVALDIVAMTVLLIIKSQAIDAGRTMSNHTWVMDVETYFIML